MSSDNLFSVVIHFTWLQAVYLQYMADKFKRSLSETLCAMLREFAVKDRHGLSFEAVRRHVLASDELKQLEGDVLFELLADLERLGRKRDDPDDDTPTVTQVFRGRRRRIPWLIGKTQISLSPLDYALVDFYRSVMAASSSLTLRRLVRNYMRADTAANTSEFYKYIDEAKARIPTEEHHQLLDELETLKTERARIQEIRKNRKSKKTK